MLGENVEDQLGTVDDPQIQALSQVSGLGGGEILVEDHQVHARLEAADHQIPELSLSHHEPAVYPGAVLDDHVDDVDPGRAGQLLELCDGVLEIVGLASRRHRDQDRALPVADASGLGGSRELLLEGADPVLEVQVELCRRGRIQELDLGSVLVGWKQRRYVGIAREPVLIRGDAGHGVEAEQRQVGEVVSSQALVAQVGVDAAQAAQPALPSAHASPIRHLDGASVADHHVADAAPAVHQDPDLSPDLVAELRELARQLAGEQAVRGHAATAEAFDALDLARLEPVGVAEDADLLSSDGKSEACTNTPTACGNRLLLNEGRTRQGYETGSGCGKRSSPPAGKAAVFAAVE